MSKRLSFCAAALAAAFAVTAHAETALYAGSYSCALVGEEAVVKFNGSPPSEFKTWGGTGSDYTNGQIIAPNAAGEYRFPSSRWFNFVHSTSAGYRWEMVPDGRTDKNYRNSGCVIVVSDRFAGGLAHGGAALAARHPLGK